MDRTSQQATALYASAGSRLIHFEVDVANAVLHERATLQLPADVQYAWPHPSRKFLYITWSNGGAAGAPPGSTQVPRGNIHGAGAYRIEANGALTSIGKSINLPARPIHNSIDASGTHLLIAYNEPSNLTIHNLNADGTIGAVVPQTAKIDAGIYAHQIRTDASGKTLILVTRGNGPSKTRPEDRGALKVFRYADGIVSNEVSVAPNGGDRFVRSSGVDGIIVTDESPAAWADAIAALLTDPARRAAIGAAAAQDLRARFPTWDQVLAEDVLPVWRGAARR